MGSPRVAIVLLAALTALAPAAFPQQPPDAPASRAEAVAALSSADAAARAAAVAWLASHGSMADAPRLQQRLRDESELVREYAEQGLWLLEQYEKSLEWFRRALEANPNMSGVALNIRALERLLEEKRRRST